MTYQANTNPVLILSLLGARTAAGAAHRVIFTAAQLGSHISAALLTLTFVQLAPCLLLIHPPCRYAPHSLPPTALFPLSLKHYGV